jgi:tungstate transport system substrate-binding protein
MKLLKWFFISVLLLSLLAGCIPSPTHTVEVAPPTTVPVATDAPTAAPATDVPATEAPKTSTELILATTTSTRDSGLLDVLLPLFEAQSGLKVKMVAVGTGAALKMGEEGNADVLLVHAPKSELDLMDKGFGKDRLLVMHNDFIIVGPASDPAGIKGLTTAMDAYKKIAETKSIFVTRGDDSGTNKAELTIWKSAEITPEGDWYVSTGQGMGDTLRVATEKEGYTFTDRASYLALKDTLQLDVLVEGDKALLNIYHVITVNPDKWPLVNYTGAKAFADFMVSPETQINIADFGMAEFGQSLFIPDAGKAEDQVGQ